MTETDVVDQLTVNLPKDALPMKAVTEILRLKVLENGSVSFLGKVVRTVMDSPCRISVVDAIVAVTGKAINKASEFFGEMKSAEKEVKKTLLFWGQPLLTLLCPTRLPDCQ